MKLLSRVRFFVTPWTVAYYVPPPTRFSRQAYWSGLPFPSLRAEKVDANDNTLQIQGQLWTLVSSSEVRVIEIQDIQDN